MFGKIKTKGRDRPFGEQKKQQQKIKAPITHKIHKQHKQHPINRSNFQNSNNNKNQHLPNNRSLKGAEFRLLNEILYTQDSKKAVQYFQQNPQYCNTYHDGFREQTTTWQINPLDLIIKILLSYGKRLESKNIIDLGCGEGRLHMTLQRTGCKMRSYDIMPMKPFIIKADISNLDLKNQTQDIAVFCLSLMGLNYIDFILQALRVLKTKGQLFIAQVQSRCKDWKLFEQMLKLVGCKLKEIKKQKYFRLMIFEKSQAKFISRETKLPRSNQTFLEYSQKILNPCIYKRR